VICHDASPDFLSAPRYCVGAGVVAALSADAPAGVLMVGSPLVRFDQSHQPMIAATSRRMRINTQGAPRFFSSIPICATVVLLLAVDERRTPFLLQRLFPTSGPG
jgi:hypothetical protein